MPPKIIVSYDGTDNDRDALALGQILAEAGASLELAYVRHAHELDSGRERLAEEDARTLLREGAEAAGMPDVPQHVVLSGSTPEGLRDLGLSSGAEVLAFGSEYRTAKGHVDPQRSARRLLDGGQFAIALAPAGLAENGGYAMRTVAAVGEGGDPCALETAESLAGKVGAAVAKQADRSADLLVVGSIPGTVTGRVRISAAAEYVIELASCPVLVLPRGVPVLFGGA
ncbi:MAG: universal stress protein [Actinobacteria bacterium]|nr:universal stress protein [Actinomycetota bacterium]